jgi:predicted porin
MKKTLFGTTAMLGMGLAAAPAVAADPIKLTVGGFFKSAYQVVIDDDSEGEIGNEHNTDGFFSDAEIHFTGSTVLDNGLEVGARVELEGESENDGEGGGDQIDEAWIWFSGGFGEVRIGSEDEALANACIVPPGGTGNFSAFSPNQWGANSGPVSGRFGDFSSNSVCAGVDDQSDAQKIVYITPNFGGFQLTVSYTPNDGAETHNDGGGPHLGMPQHFIKNGRHNFSAYATYSYVAEDWGVTAGVGGSWEGHAEQQDFAEVNEKDFYQAGVNLDVGNFSIGIVGEFFNDVNNDDFRKFGFGFSELDVWSAGIGAAYRMDAWTFGLQYSHREDDLDISGSVIEDMTMQQDRVVATANYAMGPGINVDAEIGYTWLDTDPELEDNPGVGINGGFGDGIDDYDGIEFGIGTTLTF